MVLKRWFLICLVFIIVPTVFAEEQSFRNDYTVEYFVTETAEGLSTRVKFTIAITNLNATEYVDKIGLSFPSTFSVSGVSAADDKGVVKPEISTEGDKTSIKLTFNDPKMGKNSVNVFGLEFKQDNLFKRFGNIWEVMLPTVGNTSSYKIVVHLPHANKKLSIAKPKPDSIDGSKIIWNNPTIKTIYAVFGDTQYYDLDLTYHLENPKIIPVYQEIALPPDTQHQKIYIEALDPSPYSVSTDEDGNYMARYNLKPKEKLDITLDSVVQLQVQPRDEVVEAQRKMLSGQKSYLLQKQQYWEVDSVIESKLSKNPKEIYDFVLQKLEYDHERLKGPLKRFGAAEALKNPAKAVCTEFTDTFVALARQNGLYTREVEGYGFSQDQYLRPLSLISDVLHAWPEYYDDTTDLWKPVDPTWEDTSGIDYFSSFDLSHVTFAVHGKDSEYPYPAGSYKIEDSKDIKIEAITEKPVERIQVSTEAVHVPQRLSDRAKGDMEYTIYNNSNVYLWSVPVSIEAAHINFPQDNQILLSLAPFEKKTVKFAYTVGSRKTKVDDTIRLIVNGELEQSQPVAIVPYYFILAFNVATIILAFCALLFLIKMLRHLFR